MAHRRRATFDPHGSRAVASIVALAVPCILAVGALLFWAWSQRDALRLVPTSLIHIETRLLPRIAHWQRAPRAMSALRGVLFGDSIAACGRKFRLNARIEKRLGDDSVNATVLRASHAALRPIHFYYLLDEVLRGQPDFVVVEVNLRAFSPSFTRNPAMRLPALSRELSLGTAWKIRAPLASEGLTLIDPWIFRLQDRFDALYLMDSVRFLRDSLLDGLGGAINRELGLATAPTGLGHDARERRRNEALADYDVDQAGEPAAFVLRALLGRLRRAHVATLMYVTPINVQRLNRIGVRHELDLRRRTQALRAAVGAAPEEWLDLHATLGRKSFRDERNHLRDRGCARVSTAIAQATVARMSPHGS